MLKINDLVVAFETEQGELTAVKGVSLDVAPGETLALVGESGCGKTVLCKSMLKILCERGNIKQGEIFLEGKDLVPLTEKEMIPHRGSGIAMVFQDPMTSLDPTMPVGEQIAEMVMIAEQQEPEDDSNEKSRKEIRAEARERAIELMRLVEIDQPELRYGQMPHHFSGGMRQRIAIAIALAGQPQLLLADEPTTALDQETQAQILELLKKINIATIFITHDLSLVEGIADRVAIMQAGEIVETGPVEKVFENPQHPYTRKLLGYLDYGKGRGHSHRHHFLHGGEALPEDAAKPHVHGNVPLHAHAKDGSRIILPEPLVEVRNIKKYFPLGRRQIQKVLDGFSTEIYKGEILGIVGPSGCGKSTLARCIMGMHPLSGGEIIFHNSGTVSAVKSGDLSDTAADICFADSMEAPFRNASNWKQMIFQDSASAFNPRMTVGEIIAEPMKLAKKKRPRSMFRQGPFEATTCQYCKSWKTKMTMRDRVIELMRQVELDPELIDRHPYEISGGQRQRVAIARAISVDPEFIVADEPISSLDISTQAQIIHLFRKLQEERNLTILLIAHDLPMVNHISDRIIQM